MRTMAVAVDVAKQRLITGFLDHVIDGRIATRWAVLEQSDDQKSVILRLFRCEKELCEKHAYTLCKDNFIGTERGSVKQYYKKTPARYWAIITVYDQTLLFHDSHSKSTSTFEKWDKILKDFWSHQSWLVTPLKGPNSFINEKGLTLHINRASVCFAYLNPPRHYCRLCLENIDKVSYDGTRLCFDLTKDDKIKDCYEVKTERERFACRIKEVVENLLSRCKVIPSPESTKSCPAEIQKTSAEFQTSSAPRSERLNLNPLPLPQSSERPSPDSSIDQTTGEDIHMDINSLFPSNKANSASSLSKSSTSSSRSPEVEVPDIKIIPVSASSGSEESKQELSCHKKQVPVIPPRTTSCSGSSGSATKTEARVNEPPVSNVSLQKGMSASTGKLYVHKSDQAWDSSPGLATRRRPPDGASTRVTSAVQLPLPKPPVCNLPTAMDRASWIRQTGQDDLDSISDSMSSIASQNSDVTSMDITQSLSSLSSEEERCRSSSTDSSQKSPVRKSALSLNGCPNSTSGLPKNPGYNRSFSVPTELPRNHHFSDTETKCLDPDPSEQDYMNVSKESLSAKISDPDDSDYINVTPENCLYVNPLLTTSANPIPLPPRHPAPPSRSNRTEGSGVASITKSYDSMELHEVLNAMLTGDEQGGTMGLPQTVWLKFCLNCDIDRNSYSSNNWRGLAEQLGLSSSDIVLVDDYSRRYSKKPTQVILAYWERQAQPRRPFSKTELISMLHQLDRQDLLDILIQREKYTGAGAK